MLNRKYFTIVALATAVGSSTWLGIEMSSGHSDRSLRAQSDPLPIGASVKVPPRVPEEKGFARVLTLIRNQRHNMDRDRKMFYAYDERGRDFDRSYDFRRRELERLSDQVEYDMKRTDLKKPKLVKQETDRVMTAFLENLKKYRDDLKDRKYVVNGKYQRFRRDLEERLEDEIQAESRHILKPKNGRADFAKNEFHSN
jgi:hypothetical protein